MISSTAEEIVENGYHYSLRIPAYDISQKVKEANEALKKDVTPSRETKQFRVKFGPVSVHYEPEAENSSDTAWEESTDGTDIVLDRVLDISSVGPSSNGLHTDLLMLQMKEGVNAYCNSNEPLLNNNLSTNKHDFSLESSIETKKLTVTKSENLNPNDNIGDSYSVIELVHTDESNGEISLSNISEVLNKIEFNEREDKTFSIMEGMGLQTLGDEDMTIFNVAEKGYGEVSSGEELKKVNSEDSKCTLKHVGSIETPITYSSEECMAILPLYEPHSEHLAIKCTDELLDGEKTITHQNMPGFCPSKLEKKVSDLHKSQHKYLMHHKWSDARLPTYNGLNSEYGLTAEMLEERKRKAEIIRQKLWEKKKQEEEIQEQKRKENDESFKEWLRKKEAERRKLAEEKKDYEFVYDQQEAENAFQVWLKRKSKEMRLQKKQKDAEREYEKKLAQRRTYEESQREFKRWLRDKVKKPAPPGKYKGYSFHSMRKSYKRYVMEKNNHMKNTCKIYLGH